jgi:hypothetical protein
MELLSIEHGKSLSTRRAIEGKPDFQKHHRGLTSVLWVGPSGAVTNIPTGTGNSNAVGVGTGLTGATNVGMGPGVAMAGGSRNALQAGAHEDDDDDAVSALESLTGSMTGSASAMAGLGAGLYPANSAALPPT